MTPTVEGIASVVSRLHPAKAESPIVVMPFGMTTSVMNS